MLPQVVEVVDRPFSHLPFCTEVSWCFPAFTFLGLLSCQLLFCPTLVQLLPPTASPACPCLSNFSVRGFTRPGVSKNPLRAVEGHCCVGPLCNQQKLCPCLISQNFLYECPLHQSPQFWHVNYPGKLQDLSVPIYCWWAWNL